LPEAAQNARQAGAFRADEGEIGQKAREVNIGAFDYPAVSGRMGKAWQPDRRTHGSLADFSAQPRQDRQQMGPLFPIYERHFKPWQGKSLTFLEIGVKRGGSLKMWQLYFGPLARIVGIDIDPDCAAHEVPGIFVRIGDQSDPAFLQSVIDAFGVPDVVLDDGSHRMEHISESFAFLYPRLPKNGVYMVEDLHTAYWKNYGGGLHEERSFINICKHLIDKLNAHHSRGAVEPDAFTNQTFGMSFYDSVVAFDKGEIFRREPEKTGVEEDWGNRPASGRAGRPAQQSTAQRIAKFRRMRAAERSAKADDANADPTDKRRDR
jgi:hypothetical protein